MPQENANLRKMYLEIVGRASLAILRSPRNIPTKDTLLQEVGYTVHLGCSSLVRRPVLRAVATMSLILSCRRSCPQIEMHLVWPMLRISWVRPRKAPCFLHQLLFVCHEGRSNQAAKLIDNRHIVEKNNEIRTPQSRFYRVSRSRIGRPNSRPGYSWYAGSDQDDATPPHNQGIPQFVGICKEMALANHPLLLRAL